MFGGSYDYMICTLGGGDGGWNEYYQCFSSPHFRYQLWDYLRVPFFPYLTNTSFLNLLTPNKLTKFMKLGNMRPRCQRHCLTNHMITIHFSWRWRWIPRAGDHFSESSRNTSRPLPLLVRACQSEWGGWGLADFPAVFCQQQGQGQGQWKSWRSAP